MSVPGLYGAASRRQSIALDLVVAWLGTVRRCLMCRPHQEVWSVKARYEQLLRLSKLLTTMASLMDEWMDG